MDWYLLPSVTDSMAAEVAVAAKGRFIGDPSYVYEHVETHREGGGDKDVKEEEVVVSDTV